LKHFGVGIETRIAKFGDFFRKQFDAICRIAEYDGLVDLKLQEWAFQLQNEFGKKEKWMTFENKVFKQCTFCRSST